MFVNAQERKERVNVPSRRIDGCVFEKMVKHLNAERGSVCLNRP